MSVEIRQTVYMPHHPAPIGPKHTLSIYEYISSSRSQATSLATSLTSLEIWMLKSLLATNALGWVIGQHTHEEVLTIGTEAWDDVGW